MESYPEESIAVMKRWKTSFYGMCRFEGRLRVRNYVCEAFSGEEARQIGLRSARLELFGVRVLEDPAEETEDVS